MNSVKKQLKILEEDSAALGEMMHQIAKENGGQVPSEDLEAAKQLAEENYKQRKALGGVATITGGTDPSYAQAVADNWRNTDK